MDGIRQWAFSACAAMAACGIARLILPKSNLQKVFGITVSVFFLCCLLSPVVVRFPSVRLDLEEYAVRDMNRRAAALEETVEAQTETAAAGRIEKIIAGLLSEMGINEADITINIIRKGQNEFQVQRADVTLPARWEQEHAAIRKRLQDTLSFPVGIGYSERFPEEDAAQGKEA